MAAVDLDDPNLSETKKDVIISSMMKAEAKVICDSVEKAFKKCANHRTFSLAWTCRKEHHAMKQCMDKYYRRADFKLWKEEYLRNIKSDHAADHEMWDK